MTEADMLRAAINCATSTKYVWAQTGITQEQFDMYIDKLKQEVNNLELAGRMRKGYTEESYDN